MDFRGLTQEVLELLSEAAVEIGNLDDRENVVYGRLRTFQALLQKLQQLELSLNPLESTVEELADMLDVNSDDVMEAVTASGVGRFQLDGRELATDELGLLIKCNEASDVTVTLTFEEVWTLLENVEPVREGARRLSRPFTAGQRKFAGSEAGIVPANPSRQKRSG